MAKVAVTSTDGELINEHFGRAGQFWIYEVDEQGEYRLLDRRQFSGSGNGLSPEDLHEQKAGLLLDVEAVLTAQIGPRAEQALARQGILAFAVSGWIGKALQTYGKRIKFVRNQRGPRLKGGTAHCGHGSCGGCF